MENAVPPEFAFGIKSPNALSKSYNGATVASYTKDLFTRTANGLLGGLTRRTRTNRSLSEHRISLTTSDQGVFTEYSITRKSDKVKKKIYFFKKYKRKFENRLDKPEFF